jgi:hypothetical protein
VFRGRDSCSVREIGIGLRGLRLGLGLGISIKLGLRLG